MEERKNFLERLQSADNEIKRAVLVVGTALVMAVVIFVWMSYFNSLVIGGAKKNAPQPPGGSGEERGFTLFFDKIGRGAASLYHAFLAPIEGVLRGIAGPKRYEIGPDSE